jgi:hypothetical protein
MSKVCPYCNTTIDETVQVCPSCNNDLAVQCPYCMQTIKAYDTVCPCCSTVLKPKDISKAFISITLVLNCLWILGNLIEIFLIISFPQMFAQPDSKSIEVFTDLLQISFGGLIVVSVPYIVSIIKNFKRKFAIAFLIFNVFLLICFLIIITSLYLRYA